MGCLKITYSNKYGALEEVPIFYLSHVDEQSTVSKKCFNCSPFGVQLSGRNLYKTGVSKDYSLGFQGQLEDDEIKGEGNSLNYEYRMHDPRLGRFFAIDPLARKYPFYSPYQFSGNRVIDRVELEGLEPGVPPVYGPVTKEEAEAGAASMMEATKNMIGHPPIFGTQHDSSPAFSMGVYRHTHDDFINAIYTLSGGDNAFAGHHPSGEYREPDEDVKEILEYNKATSDLNCYTNSNMAFYVDDNNNGYESAYCNFMLGHFIKGTGAENYVFGPTSPITYQIAVSDIVQDALKEFVSTGFKYGNSTYGVQAQMNGFMKDLSYLTIENSVGSANIWFKVESENTVKIIVSNVMSLNSGDYSKGDAEHVIPPISTVRGTGLFNIPVPYSNISQTFIFYLKY